MRCKTACAGEDTACTCPAGMTGPKHACLGTGFRGGAPQWGAVREQPSREAGPAPGMAAVHCSRRSEAQQPSGCMVVGP